MGTVRFFGHHIHSRTVLLGLFEVLIALGSVYLAAFIRRFNLPLLDAVDDTPTFWQVVVYVAVVMLSMVAIGLYQVRLREASTQIFARILLSFGLVMLVMAVISALFPLLYLGPSLFGLSVLLTLIAFGITHTLFFGIVDRNVMRRRVLFYGAGRNAASLLSKLRRRSDQRLFQLVGCVRLPAEEQIIDDERAMDLKGTLAEFVLANDIDEVVVAMDDRRGGFPTDALLTCRFAGVEVTNMLTFYERHTGKIKCDLLQPSDIIFADGFKQGPFRDAVKRLLDLVAAVVLLIPGLPLILLAGLAIKLEDGWRAPVFYRQVRVGENGHHYRIAKLRSMREDAEQAGKAQWATTDDDRVTRVGAALRKYRLDELPQLFNVIKGEMSLVGPRPERPEFVEELARKLPFYNVRHRVKPGITGWAQLCYPYGSSEEDALQKLQYDLYYVKNGGVFLDLVVLLGTVEVVLFRKGAR